jgi:hypothetical protein
MPFPSFATCRWDPTHVLVIFNLQPCVILLLCPGPGVGELRLQGRRRSASCERRPKEGSMREGVQHPLAATLLPS